MAFFEKNKDKIGSKYTLKRTKLHHFKKFSRGNMPPNPPSNAHGFAMRSMSLRDMQIPKSEKKNFLAPPLPNPGDAPALSHPLTPSHILALTRSQTLSSSIFSYTLPHQLSLYYMVH